MQIVKKFNEISTQMHHDLELEYQNKKRYGDGCDQSIFDAFQEAKQELHWDIAWQIFDEVNEVNETEKQIDLACLECHDAIAICKQKIYDVAQLASQEQAKTRQLDDYVLKIKCCETHLERVRDSVTGKSPLRNVVLDMVKDELMLDHYYIAQKKTILVRINAETLENPVLSEW